MKDIAFYWQSIVRGEETGFFAHMIKWVLWFFSMIYAAVVRLIVWSYKKGILKHKALPCKVISIGNITLGGSGKTPLVEWIVRFYQQKGKSPAVLTRGYSLKKGIYDEARLLERDLQGVAVAIGRDRFAQGMKTLQQQSVDVFVMDDGFQHWALHRDLNIVTIDSTFPFGNGVVIPGGFLREPLSALKRADIFVLTKVDLARSQTGWISERLKAIHPRALVIETIHEPQGLVNARNPQDKKNLSWLDGKAIGYVCAIGSPESFEHALVNLEAKVEKRFVFRDHHVYSEQDIRQMNQACLESQIFHLVTTAKDIVKLNQYLLCFDDRIDIFTLEVQLTIIKGREAFEERIFTLLDH